MNGTANRRPTVSTVVARLERSAGEEEPNEEVAGLTILHHGLQCAALLRRSHPGDPELQVAGLLHDVGHLLAPGHEDIHGLVAPSMSVPCSVSGWRHSSRITCPPSATSSPSTTATGHFSPRAASARWPSRHGPMTSEEVSGLRRLAELRNRRLSSESRRVGKGPCRQGGPAGQLARDSLSGGAVKTKPV